MPKLDLRALLPLIALSPQIPKDSGMAVACSSTSNFDAPHMAYRLGFAGGRNDDDDQILAERGADRHSIHPAHGFSCAKPREAESWRICWPDRPHIGMTQGASSGAAIAAARAHLAARHGVVLA